MSDQFWLTKAQLKRIEPFFPRTRGIPRVDDRRVVSGIVHVIRNGLRWRDAPAVYGPIRRSTTGSFAGPAWVSSTESSPTLRPRAARPPPRVMIDSTHLKAHRTAASLHKKGIHHVSSAARKAG